MSLSAKQSVQIRKYLTFVIKTKLEKYQPETNYMPFHYRLLGKDRYLMFSFIQSLNTTFGMSIFEQVGEIIANKYHKHAARGYLLEGSLDRKMSNKIEEIHSSLREAEREPDKEKEVEEIKQVTSVKPKRKDPDSTVDLFVLEKNDTEHYFDITSAKPNMKEFVELKRKLLKWTALRLSQDINAKVITQLAIPYNPYEPKDYDRWTLKGLYDLDEEILVGKEFWDFLGGNNTYENLLTVFASVGKKLYPIINKYINDLTKK